MRYQAFLSAGTSTADSADAEEMDVEEAQVREGGERKGMVSYQVRLFIIAAAGAQESTQVQICDAARP